MTWKRFCYYVSEILQGLIVACFAYFVWAGMKSWYVRLPVQMEPFMVFFALFLGVVLGVSNAGKNEEDEEDIDYE